MVEVSVDLLDAAAAGLLLADPRGELQVVASASKQSQLVEILQLRGGTTSAPGTGSGPNSKRARSSRVSVQYTPSQRGFTAG